MCMGSKEDIHRRTDRQTDTHTRTLAQAAPLKPVVTPVVYAVIPGPPMGDSDRQNLRMKCSSGRTNRPTLNAYVDPRYSTTRASIRKRNSFRLNKWKERRRVLIKVGAVADRRKVDALNHL